MCEINVMFEIGFLMWIGLGLRACLEVKQMRSINMMYNVTLTSKREQS